MKDSRFHGSPAADQGLKAYVGVPLSYKQIYNIGSLCVTSEHLQARDLSEGQIRALHHLADLILAEIIAHTYFLRSEDQARMAVHVAKLNSEECEPELIFAKAMASLRLMFPNTTITAPHADKGRLHLRGKTVEASLFTACLWEDVPAITERITYHNHEDSNLDSADSETYRAMACKVSSASSRYLLVESSHLKLIFDEADVFGLLAVGQCVTTCLQAEAVAELKDAKRGFLRGVQHNLRTPLHFGSSAAELLREELLKILESLNKSEQIMGDPGTARRITALLDMIDQSCSLIKVLLSFLISLDSARRNSWVDDQSSDRL